MAKATAKEETKVTEKVLEGNGVAEPEMAEVEAKAKTSKSESGETVTVPRFLFTSDTESTHHEVCVNGKIYQVKYDEPVKVTKTVADVIKNAAEQKKKVKALVNSLNGKAKEIAEE